MPVETTQAIEWAKQQIFQMGEEAIPVQDAQGNINSFFLVHFVREYFNTNSIEYSTFSYDDLEPLLQ